MWIFKYTVKGSFCFPFDMLRYNQSFPEDENDSGKLRLHSSTENEIKLVHLASDKAWKPTYSRWKSFGWEVIKEEKPYRV